MNIVYFQPPDINPKYCEVGYLVENDPGYIYYMEEPCKILISEVTIIDMERVIHDKNLGVYKLKTEGKTEVETSEFVDDYRVGDVCIFKNPEGGHPRVFTTHKADMDRGVVYYYKLDGVEESIGISYIKKITL